MCKCCIGWPDSYWGYSDCFCQTLCVIDWKIIFLKYSPSFKFTISPSHFYDYETVTVHALLLPIHGHHLVALHVFLLREARGHKIVIASDTFRRALGSNLLQPREPVLKSACPRYTIYSISLLPSYPWHFTGVLPWVLRGSAIHVFLVVWHL